MRLFKVYYFLTVLILSCTDQKEHYSQEKNKNTSESSKIDLPNKLDISPCEDSLVYSVSASLKIKYCKREKIITIALVKKEIDNKSFKVLDTITVSSNLEYKTLTTPYCSGFDNKKEYYFGFVKEYLEELPFEENDLMESPRIISKMYKIWKVDVSNEQFKEIKQNNLKCWVYGPDSYSGYDSYFNIALLDTIAYSNFIDKAKGLQIEGRLFTFKEIDLDFNSDGKKDKIFLFEQGKHDNQKEKYKQEKNYRGPLLIYPILKISENTYQYLGYNQYIFPHVSADFRRSEPGTYLKIVMEKEQLVLKYANEEPATEMLFRDYYFTINRNNGLKLNRVKEEKYSGASDNSLVSDKDMDMSAKDLYFHSLYGKDINDLLNK
jgi:hypothetical protein